MNVRKFKGKMIELGISMDDISRALERNRSTVYRKLQNSGSHFTVGEASRLADLLCLTKEEAVEIFLSESSRKCENCPSKRGGAIRNEPKKAEREDG